MGAQASLPASGRDPLRPYHLASFHDFGLAGATRKYFFLFFFYFFFYYTFRDASGCIPYVHGAE